MPLTKDKNPPRQRFERIEARITPDQKVLFKKAAALEGRTLADFVVSCVAQAAKRIVQENEVITLGERDRQVFVKALRNPPAPNKVLLAATKLQIRQGNP
jgi:uncharacterized protein (DUF1778 family)